MIYTKNILVTGCAGFIGSHLTEALLNCENQVIGIDCFRDYYDPLIKKRNIQGFINNPNFTLIQQDICSMSSFPRVDYVFHLAAQAGVRASWGNSFFQYAHDNIMATQRLLEWFKDDKILKKFVYASSSSVYGNAFVYPVTEVTIPQPISPYGVTKLAAEHLCYLYHANYGLPTVALRYFTVYGPRQRPDMAIHKFMKAIIEGKEIEIFGDGTQIRDFTYVDDIVRANLIAAYKGNPGSVYNVGGGERIQLRNLIQLIEEITKTKAKINFSEKQKGDVMETWANIESANDIGWSPEVRINDGLKTMNNWLISLLRI